MKMERFAAENNQKALMKVSEAFGDDALIYSTRSTGCGVEILAGPASGIRDDRTMQVHEAPEIQIKPSKPNLDFHLFEKLSTKLQLMDEKLKDIAFKMNHVGDDHFIDEGNDHAKQDHLLFHLLTKLGFDKAFCKQFANIYFNSAQGHGLVSASKVNHALFKRIVMDEVESLHQPNIAVLIGPTGVGKTTTALKLAKRHLNQYGAKTIGLILIDHEDLASRSRLIHYCDLWGVDLLYASHAEELSMALEMMKDKQLILIDTYGVSQRDTSKVTGLLSLLEMQGQMLSTYIILPGNVQESIVDEILKAFTNTHLRGCILTKQDECTSLASALKVLMHHQMKLAYICHGPSIESDIFKVDEAAGFAKLINHAAQENKLMEENLLRNMFRVTKQMQWEKWHTQLAT